MPGCGPDGRTPREWLVCRVHVPDQAPDTQPTEGVLTGYDDRAAAEAHVALSNRYARMMKSGNNYALRRAKIG
jgi:hypothetical protein